MLGFSAFSGGLFASLPFLLAGIANLTGGWLTDRIARASGLRAARCGLGCAAFLACAALVLGSALASDPVLKATLLAFALGSVDLALAACWAVCLDVGASHAGVVTGFMNMVGNPLCPFPALAATRNGLQVLPAARHVTWTIWRRGAP